jgi:5-methylcytosine-specific restriction enzyme A
MKQFKTEEEKAAFYNSSHWRNLRKVALKRDNNECQECKRLGLVTVDSIKEDSKRKKIKLNVHHLKEIEYHPDLALTLSNLETICLFHHNVIHDKGYKPKKENVWANDERW